MFKRKFRIVETVATDNSKIYVVEVKCLLLPFWYDAQKLNGYVPSYCTSLEEAKKSIELFQTPNKYHYL